MNGTRLLAISLTLFALGAPAAGDAPMVHCVGDACGGWGPRDYAYHVDAASFPMVDFRVGTNDLEAAHYTDVLIPPGWHFAVEEVPMRHAGEVHTPHGQYSPGPCFCLTAGSAHWWCEDFTHAVEFFIFGYDHPWRRSEDVGWDLAAQQSPLGPAYLFQESWDAPVGTGYGPVHGPCAAVGPPTLEVELLWGNCLEGVYGFLFSVHGNDGQQQSFFADVQWMGLEGTTVLPEHCELLEPWASNALLIEKRFNFYRIAAGTGPDSAYEEADLALIVAESKPTSPLIGNCVHFYGTISRLGVDYEVAGCANVPPGGDANCDGRVDGGDYTLWADHYMQEAGWRQGDFNGDGRATGADYTIWADNYGDWHPWPIPVPVPAGLALLGAAVPALLKGQRRHRPR